METRELLKKVKRIEIKTRGLTNHIFSGEYHSAFKGRGMTFSEVREYQHGDEIRTIDWNVTARFGSPFVKVFEEERELTVMLLVDVSASELFGTRTQLKKELIAELSAIISFSAIQNNDKIGVIFFSDKIEKFIPPKKGKLHGLRIIRDLLEFEPEHQKTNLQEALRYLTMAIKKRSIAFVISDFSGSPEYSDALKIANKKHDVVALKIQDRAEEKIPAMGWVHFRDPETGEMNWINSSSKKVQKEYQNNAILQNRKTTDIFRKAGVDFAQIETGSSYVKPLMNLFKKRT